MSRSQTGIGVLAVLMLFFISLQASQTPSDPLLNRLAGNWQGEGKAFGMPARLRITWEWVLGNKFIKLSLRNEMSGTNGQKQIFEGHAYYRPIGNGKYEAQWFDSRGMSFPIKAQAEGEALVALWGSPQQEEGRSSYKILDDGSIEVVDSVKQKDGTWQEFGRVVVKRQ